MKRILTIISGLAAYSLFAGGAAAQNLGSGDYAQCSVYDENGDFLGHDTVCLEEKRAALRYYKNDRNRRADAGYSGGAPYYCPVWANQGRGFPGTVYSSGRPPSTDFYGAYDRAVDGVPCMPRGTHYNNTGYY